MTSGNRTDRPSSARIEPVVEPDAELQEILAGALTHDGTPLNIFGVLGRHPKLLKRFNLLGGFLLNKGLLPGTRTRDRHSADRMERPSTIRVRATHPDRAAVRSH